MTSKCWLMQVDSDGDLYIRGGPFDPIEDDARIEDALLDCLAEHPWDDEPRYWILIEAKPEPVLEEFDEDYLEQLAMSVWGEPPDEIEIEYEEDETND